MKVKRLGIKGRLTLKKLYLDFKSSRLKDLRNEFFRYLKKLPEIVHLRNLIFISSILSFIIFVMFFQRFEALESFYLEKKPVPGGTYREGVIGNIEKINPLFINTEAEASANRLIFSGLTKLLPDNLIEGDLANNWSVNEEKTEYTFILRENLKWHDGQAITADDVVFTIGLIQNPDARSNLGTIWSGVKTEKLSDNSVKFLLPNPYANFLETSTQAILPQHLLGDIEARSIKIAEYNLNPVGSGPYKFVRFDQSGDNTILLLSANKDYLPRPPYISDVHFRLYGNYEELYRGIIRKQIDGVAQVSFDRIEEINNLAFLETHLFYLPRYKNIQLNLANSLLADKEIRKALTFSINRQKIVTEALKEQAMVIYSPITPGRPGHDKNLDIETYNPEMAINTLNTLGYVLPENTAYRSKGEQKLEFNLIYPSNNEDKRVAEIVRNQLEVTGFKINLVESSPETIQADHIRPRNFDLILLGQNIGISSDLYSFWHSSQIKDPGLNITGYKSREVDKLIEIARKTTDSAEKAARHKRVQALILEEKPAIYLYNPVYSYAISNKIKGFTLGRINTPVDHLNSISDWYIKETKK